MAAVPTIDPEQDFASYYLNGGDPDMTCERLYRWHQLLWGRTVSGVTPWQLEVVRGRRFELALTSASGARFRLRSDGMITTWEKPGWASQYKFDADLVAEIAADVDDFNRVASKMGAYIPFPLNSADQSGDTINQARGKHPLIVDRFDLTLECIRAHYAEQYSPLAERLSHFRGFFDLFGTFDTYVRFFLLDDLLTSDRSGVLSLMSGEPLAGFEAPAIASTAAQYAEFRTRSISFVEARNDRIVQLQI